MVYLYIMAYICLPYPVGRMSFPSFFFKCDLFIHQKACGIFVHCYRLCKNWSKVCYQTNQKNVAMSLLSDLINKLRQFRTFLSIIFTRVCWGVEASPFCLWFRSLHIVWIVFENIIWFWVACCCLGLCLRGFEQCLASGWCSYVCKIPLLSCSQIWEE